MCCKPETLLLENILQISNHKSASCLRYCTLSVLLEYVFELNYNVNYKHS